MNRRYELTLFLLLMCCTLFAGCMSKASPDAAFLLEEDYARMTDAELVAYEQELSDELVRASRSNNRDVGVGFGLGSWGSNVGVGVHADKWFGGGESDIIRDLRIRRDQVRDEMRQRGLLPE